MDGGFILVDMFIEKGWYCLFILVECFVVIFLDMLDVLFKFIDNIISMILDYDSFYISILGLINVVYGYV